MTPPAHPALRAFLEHRSDDPLQHVRRLFPEYVLKGSHQGQEMILGTSEHSDLVKVGYRARPGDDFWLMEVKWKELLLALQELVGIQEQNPNVEEDILL